jgi:hypothetical protein
MVTTLFESTVTISVPGPATAINYEVLGQNCSTIAGYSFIPSPFNDVEICKSSSDAAIESRTYYFRDCG